jgi:hypothetical protein
MQVWLHDIDDLLHCSGLFLRALYVLRVLSPFLLWDIRRHVD